MQLQANSCMLHGGDQLITNRKWKLFSFLLMFSLSVVRKRNSGNTLEGRDRSTSELDGQLWAGPMLDIMLTAGQVDVDLGKAMIEITFLTRIDHFLMGFGLIVPSLQGI